MATLSIFKRSDISNRKCMLCSDSGKFCEKHTSEDAFVRREMETFSIFRRLVEKFSQKFKKDKKRKDLGSYLIEESEMERASSSSCISLYIKGGGCNRAGSCEETAVNGLRKSSISEDCLPLKGAEKRNSREMKGFDRCRLSSTPEITLPDDVLEMILVRLPLRTLIRARVVCKKWSQLIVSPTFMQFRCGSGHNNPWLFVFGLTRVGARRGEVFAFDVVENCWHAIRNDLLRYMHSYSVASIGSDIYIVGGCDGFKPRRGVLVFSPLTSSWRGVSPLKVARLEPVLGVFEVSRNCSIFQNQDKRQDQNHPRLKTRHYGVSNVYEDPHRFSISHQLGDTLNESASSVYTSINPSKIIGQWGSNKPKIALIVVGGQGLHGAPLDSGDIYDPINDTWTEIARLPEDFGIVSSGAVCRGKFHVYSSVSGKFASYDLERGFWVVVQTSQPPPCIRSYSPRLVSCRSRLFMCCAYWSERHGQANNRREQAVRKLWELDTATHAWSEVSKHRDAPMDQDATFVADCERIYGLEVCMVFGQFVNVVTKCRVSGNEIEWSSVTRQRAGHEACGFSFLAWPMVVLH